MSKKHPTTLIQEIMGLCFYVCDDEWFEKYCSKPKLMLTKNMVGISHYSIGTVLMQKKIPTIYIRKSAWKTANGLEKDALLTHEFIHVLLGHTYRKFGTGGSHKEMRRLLSFNARANKALKNLCVKSLKNYVKTLPLSQQPSKIPMAHLMYTY